MLEIYEQRGQWFYPVVTPSLPCFVDENKVIPSPLKNENDILLSVVGIVDFNH